MDIEKFIQKANNLSKLQKFYMASLILIIFIMMFYLLIGTKTIQTIEYSSGCKEVFINGEINGSYCESDREMIESQNPLYYNIDQPEFNINIS